MTSCILLLIYGTLHTYGYNPAKTESDYPFSTILVPGKFVRPYTDN
jgi:hypothetical protein